MVAAAITQNWGKLPEVKQDELKQFAVQILSNAVRPPTVQKNETLEVWEVSMNVALGVAGATFVISSDAVMIYQLCACPRPLPLCSCPVYLAL